jgi:hypothetical protein
VSSIGVVLTVSELCRGEGSFSHTMRSILPTYTEDNKE